MKEVTVISGKMRQTFSESSKKRIVEDSYQSELSLNKFAKKSGISPATLCMWRKQLKNDCASEGGVQIESSQSFDDLRSENHKLRTEIFKLKAYLGHKLYELDSPKFAS